VVRLSVRASVGTDLIHLSSVLPVELMHFRHQDLHVRARAMSLLSQHSRPRPMTSSSSMCADAHVFQNYLQGRPPLRMIYFPGARLPGIGEDLRMRQLQNKRMGRMLSQRDWDRQWPSLLDDFNLHFGAFPGILWSHSHSSFRESSWKLRPVTHMHSGLPWKSNRPTQVCWEGMQRPVMWFVSIREGSTGELDVLTLSY